MKPTYKHFTLACMLILCIKILYAQTAAGDAALQVKTANGVLQGVNESGIRSFKGVPFAAPPVGQFRWREPQPVKNWTGIRKADKFGPRAVQLPLFGDMNFRSNGMSEDCLYLNVWTPAKTATEKLPVLVYFYGGGLMAGDGSEPRYDGESMARQGIVAITVNYRLSVFGFFAHPELTKESPNKASGNYGFMDQAAALKWVRQNIAAFGGDPQKVTIAGESVGSFSVSAQMASPLAKKLFAGAIGESGSLLGDRKPISLAEAEKFGTDFANSIGANSLQALRAISSDSLIKATAKPGLRFPVNVDGYFFPKSPEEIYQAGEQSHVPLLVGWNSEEGSYKGLLGPDPPSPENFKKAVEKIYGDKAAEVLKVYAATTEDEVKHVGTHLASDMFIAFGTWRWADMHSKTGGKPVYRYYYQHPRPQMRPEMGNATADLAGGIIKGKAGEKPKAQIPMGAVHSAEIEYALGNLPGNKVYAWQPADFTVSKTMQAQFANFVKTGDPNGSGLPQWPAIKPDTPAEVMHIDTVSKAEPEKYRNRYLTLQKLMK